MEELPSRISHRNSWGRGRVLNVNVWRFRARPPTLPAGHDVIHDPPSRAVRSGDLWSSSRMPPERFRRPCRGAPCGAGKSGGLRRPANIQCTSGARSAAPNIRCASGARSAALNIRCTSGARSAAPNIRCASGARSAALNIRCTSGARSAALNIRCASGARSAALNIRCASGARSAAFNIRATPPPQALLARSPGPAQKTSPIPTE